MDWIKVKVKHILYSKHLSDPQFRAWITSMAITADMEAIPGRKDYTIFIPRKVLGTYEEAQRKTGVSMDLIQRKVLDDVEKVTTKRIKEKEKKAKQREKDENVPQGLPQGRPRNVPGTDIDKSKIREKENYSKDIRTNSLKAITNINSNSLDKLVKKSFIETNPPPAPSHGPDFQKYTNLSKYHYLASANTKHAFLRALEMETGLPREIKEAAIEAYKYESRFDRDEAMAFMEYQLAQSSKLTGDTVLDHGYFMP